MTAAPTCVYTEASQGTGTTFPNPQSTTVSTAGQAPTSFTGSQSLLVGTTAAFPSSGKLVVLTVTSLGSYCVLSYTGKDATHFTGVRYISGDTGNISTTANQCFYKVADVDDILVVGQGGTSSGTGTTTAPSGAGSFTQSATSGSVASTQGRADVWRRILTASDFDSSGQLKQITVDSSKYTNHRFEAVIERHANGFIDAACEFATAVDNTNSSSARSLTDTTKAGFLFSVWAEVANTAAATMSWNGGTGQCFFDDGTGTNQLGDHSAHFGLNNSGSRRTLADFQEFASTVTLSSWNWSAGEQNTTHRIIVVTFVVAPDPVVGNQATEHDTPQAGIALTERIGAQAIEHDHPVGSAGNPVTVVGNQATEHDTPQAGQAFVGTLVVGSQATEHDVPHPGGFTIETWTEHLASITAAHFRLGTLTLRARKMSTTDVGDVQIALLEGTTVAAGPTAFTALTDSFADYTLDCSAYAPTDGTNLYIRYSFRRPIDGTLVPAISWIGLGWESWAVEHDHPQVGIATKTIYGAQAIEHDHPQGGAIQGGTFVPGTQAAEHDHPQTGVGGTGGDLVPGAQAIEHDHPVAGSVSGAFAVNGMQAVEHDHPRAGAVSSLFGTQAVEHDVPQAGSVGQPLVFAGQFTAALHLRWEARIHMKEQVLTSLEDWEVEVIYKIGRETADPTDFTAYLSWQPTRYADEPGNDFTGADEADWWPAVWQTVDDRFFLIETPPAIATPARRHVFVGLDGNGERVVLHAGSREVR